MNTLESCRVAPAAELATLGAPGANDRRLALFHAMIAALGDQLSAEELDMHFLHMPARYWHRATVASVRRQLELIHEFFTRLSATDEAGTACIVHWHAVPERGLTAVEICTWDRLGLLAQVAGAFAAVGLNIERADIFTRADNVVLDVFEVSAPGGHPVRHEARLKQMAAVLGRALKPGGTLPPIPATRSAPVLPPDVRLATSPGDKMTMLAVEADDRVGLLHSLFTALARGEVNVAHAIITTTAGRAGDVFYLTDSYGREMRDPARLEHIRALVLGTLV